MRSALTCAILVTVMLAAASANAAGTILVRAGEHADFSRLVVEQGKLVAAEQARTAGALVIWYADPALEFDTSGVFAMIPKSRVATVTGVTDANRAGLKITYACECHAEISAAAGNRLVIDIRAGAETLPADAASAGDPGQDAPFADPTDSASLMPADLFRPGLLDLPKLEGGAPLAATAAAAPAELSPDDDAAAGDAALPSDGSDLQETDEPPAIDEPPPTATDAPPPEEVVPVSQALLDQQVDLAERALLEQLARAADQGLIQFADDTSQQEPDPPAEVPANPPTPSGQTGGVLVGESHVQADQPAPEESGSEGQLLAQTAVDRDAPLGPEKVIPAAPICPAAEDLAIAGWAGDGSFSDQLAELNRQLIGEFDRPDRQANAKLVRYYLHFGFAAEAKAQMLTFGVPESQAPLLTDLAAIIGDGAPMPDGPVRSGLECDGLQIWILLASAADPGLLQGPPADMADAAIASFGELPIDLRRLLGPRLVERLLDLDLTGSAGTAAAIVERAAGDNGPALILAQARLAAATGREDAALDLLLSAELAVSDLAGRAMVLAADLVLGKGKPIGAGFVDQVAAAAFEQRGTALGVQLRMREIRLRAGSDNLHDALDMLRADAGQSALPQSEFALVMAGLLIAAAPGGDEANYVGAILDHADMIGDGPEFHAARLDMAAKLQAIGLAGLAEQMLMPLPAELQAQASLTAARAALDQSMPDLALQRLSAASGPETDLIRMRALIAQDGTVPPTIRTGPNPEFAFSLGDWNQALHSARAELLPLAVYMGAEGDGATGVAPHVPTPRGAVDAEVAGPSPDQGAAARPGPDQQTESEGTDVSGFIATSDIPAEMTLDAATRMLEQGRQAREILERALTGTELDPPVTAGNGS